MWKHFDKVKSVLKYIYHYHILPPGWEMAVSYGEITSAFMYAQNRTLAPKQDFILQFSGANGTPQRKGECISLFF